jgi:predicted Rossmann-fold nucleotide-binding protein
MEIITWRKLGLYSGNVVIYNVDGYFDDLIAMLHHAIDEGFMHDEHLDDVTIVTDADAAVKAAIAPSEKMPLITEF